MRIIHPRRIIVEAREFLNDIYFNMHKNIYPIEQFRNKYSGNKCFIVGNGPSLNASDLDRIHELGIVTFAANKIYAIFPKTKWRPTYISISDSGNIYDRDIISNIQKAQMEMLFVRSQMAYVVRNFKCPVCPVHTNASRKLLKSPNFSMDCSDINYGIATVTYFNMQLAAYMGFKEIYLIGVDHKYNKTLNKDGSITENNANNSYFEGLNQAGKGPAAAIWEMSVAYEYAEKYSREHGFRIFNATRGGYLETFERVDLDKIFEG